ncbi:MAG: DNA repair protein RadA [Phycisphaeraceae bacterium]
MRRPLILIAMAKVKTRFVCKECGGVQHKWMGKCPDCGAWDALEAFRDAGKSAQSDPFTSLAPDAGNAIKATPIGEIDEDDQPTRRIATGIGELDRVLGGATGDAASPASSASRSTGGLVPGSAVLIGGDPGIGKSTLMLQAAAKLAETGRRVLYVTSEESAHQLRMRADRLRGDRELSDHLFVLADTNLARILEQARRVDPEVLVIDSVQMIYKGDLPAAPGSVTQLRSCCMELVHQAKLTGAALLMVGHVTKKGALAGPRLLEHMVDAVLYFEGDRYHSHRIVRGIKNRFGTTLEVGLFEMTGKGLSELADGRGLLAKEYATRAGSVVCPVLQGSRCLLVEVQALTAAGFLGNAKRKVSGLDSSRLAMLIAVLEKRGGLRLSDQDIFASSVGGMKVAEPASDLALALAIAGAFSDRSLESGTCAVGEIGLGGEVRHCQQMEQRIRESARLGFKRILAPADAETPPGDAKLIKIQTLDQALEHLG